jgi:hypothetical protein
MRLAGGDPSPDFVNIFDARFAGPDLLLTCPDLFILGEARLSARARRSRKNSTPPQSMHP